MIPDIFRAINIKKIYHDMAQANRRYFFATNQSGKASECIECGQCEGACPQHLPIIDYLKDGAELFDKA